ncbi:hypothetical protein BH11PSE11_BH11PSE11_26160 [soil metagenome]
MPQVLAVLLFVAIFIFAPLKGALIFTGAVLFATIVVQASTAAISKVSVTITEAFKAIVYSLFFTAVAAFTVMSFMRGAPSALVTPATVAALAGLQYGGYVLGFMIALGLTFVHAAMVALASTLITCSALWFIAKLLLP